MTNRKHANQTTSSSEPTTASESPATAVAAPFRVPVPLSAPVLRSSAEVVDALGGTEAAPDVTAVLRRKRGQGQALPADTAARFGEAYGGDMSGVRVHTDTESDHLARSMQATAFTHGSDVYFSAGAYAPGSTAGQHLLAHELAHVAQHRRGEFGATGSGTTIGRANDPAEAAADRMADGALGSIRRSHDAAIAAPGVAAAGQPGTIRRGFFSRAAAPKRAEELDSLDKHKNPNFQQGGPEKSAKNKYSSTPDGKFSAASSASKREGVEKIKEAEVKKELHQPVADLGEIYAHVEMLEAEFKYRIQEIAANEFVKGKPEFRPGSPVKSLDRTLEKLGADYKDDASRLVDLVGGTIVFDNPDDLITAYGYIKGAPMFNIVRVKNGLAKGKMYGDINMSLEMGGADYEVEENGTKRTEHYAGFIVELQLHLAPIANTKKHAHKEYEEQRSIEAKYSGKKPESGAYSAADKAEWHDLQEKMEFVYGKAWAEIGAKLNVDPKVVAKKLEEAIPTLDAR